MDAIKLLTERRSIPKLSLPCPNKQELDVIIQAGLRAPDHGGLTPWQFIIAKEEGLKTLSSLFSSAQEKSGAEIKKIEKASLAPFRAPMVITVVAKTKSHPKVPLIEQYISAGCAVHAMQMACIALGYQAFWRTGELAYHPNVKLAFNLKNDDQIVGFLYVGTPDCQVGSLANRDQNAFVRFL